MMVYRPDKVEFFRRAPDIVLGDMLRNRDELAEKVVILEQQLAQAREDYDRAIFDMQAMIDHAQQQAQWEAAMRALLERVATESIPNNGACCFCEPSYDYTDGFSVMEHEDTCPIALARALLAQHKEPTP